MRRSRDDVKPSFLAQPTRAVSLARCADPRRIARFPSRRCRWMTRPFVSSAPPLSARPAGRFPCRWTTVQMWASRWKARAPGFGESEIWRQTGLFD